MIKIKKIIIWGHMLHSHTHSYIHNAFYIAFKYLGYDTYWYDDNTNVDNIDFSNSLFITEHQVNKKIPLRQDCLYLSHYIDENDYTNIPKSNIIILKVSERDFLECDLNKNYTYTKLQYNNNLEYYANCDGYNCLYIYWATDLLPYEINNNINNIDNIILQNNERIINFIGMMTQSWEILKSFCDHNNIIFNNYGASFDINSYKNKSINENVNLIQSSIIAPALQDNYQIEHHYIPCRIFKNISYGKMGMTNNKLVHNIFNEKILYDYDINLLITKGLEFENNINKKEIIVELMNIVKNNHTYLNRINTIKRFISDYTEFIL